MNLNQPLPAFSFFGSNLPPNNVVTFLTNVQANILKGHGRKFTANVFFKITDPNRARSWLSRLDITSALTQLMETERFKQRGQPGDTVIGLAFSALGLQALGVDARKLRALEPSFLNGMQKAALNDPASAQWDIDLPHGWLLIADAEKAVLERVLINALEGSAGAIQVQQIEYGEELRNPAGNGLEHFGYVDGRSQPLAMQNDVDNEFTNGVVRLFDPAVHLSQALVADPFAPGCYASYFVFRKLEQNVAAFKAREAELAIQLGLFGEQAERAGALVVGRFEDGTPVVSANEEQGESAVPNNFNYASDPAGRRCPFHAHIRKTNPRGPDTNQYLMFRRGIPYGGPRLDLATGVAAKNFPSGGVGLLFQAYMSSISNQFEVTQAGWANNPMMSKAGPGLDPVIGQNPTAPAQDWPYAFDESSTRRFDFRDFVTMRGGEYFFAPSIPMIRSLA
jgi:Dyp-type peroxidase family